MNTIQTILYATDFSAQSEAAFPFAVALARDYGARLVVAHVVPPPMTAYTPGSLAVIEPEGSPEEIRQQLGRFDPQDPRVRVEFCVAQGDAATEILQMARKSHCDIVVIGTHGRSGISRMIAGSVAEAVLRLAPCPVVTIRCPVPSTSAASKSDAADGAVRPVAEQPAYL